MYDRCTRWILPRFRLFGAGGVVLSSSIGPFQRSMVEEVNRRVWAVTARSVWCLYDRSLSLSSLLLFPPLPNIRLCSCPFQLFSFFNSRSLLGILEGPVRRYSTQYIRSLLCFSQTLCQQRYHSVPCSICTYQALHST